MSSKPVEMSLISLDQNELVAIFGLYAGCNAEYRRSSSKIEHLSAAQVIRMDAMSKSKLWLTPMGKLTEAQILEICKVACEGSYGDYRFSKWEITREGRWDDLSKNVIVKNKNSPDWFIVDMIDGEVHVCEGEYENQDGAIRTDYQQWYFRNGIAIPIYPYGKTAIELGVAIDITEKFSKA